MTRPEAITWLTLIRDGIGYGLMFLLVYLAGFGHGCSTRAEEALLRDE